MLPGAMLTVDKKLLYLQVLGLVGTNGIGKSTALKVLSGKLKPNLGRFDVSSLSRLHYLAACGVKVLTASCC